MQKILSSMVLRDYRQYEPQQLQLFRRSASVNKHKYKYEKNENEKIGQTKQSEHNQGVAENIQTTQFNQQRIQVQPIGDVISIIESKIHTMILGESVYNQRKFQQTKIHSTEPQRSAPAPVKQDLQTEQTNKNPLNSLVRTIKPKQKQKQDNSASFLKKYRQKLQQKKKYNTNSFKLKQFKDKLNYTMYRHVTN